MPAKKKGKTVESSPAPVAFRRRLPIYKEESFGERGEDTAYEPLWVRYQINLTYVELDAIPYGTEATAQAAWQAIAPYVVAWNIAAPDPETGEARAVPPPAEGGWEVCRHLDAIETAWLLRLVKFAYRAHAGSKQGKATSTPSDSGLAENGEPT